MRKLLWGVSALAAVLCALFLLPREPRHLDEPAPEARRPGDQGTPAAMTAPAPPPRPPAMRAVAGPTAHAAPSAPSPPAAEPPLSPYLGSDIPSTDPDDARATVTGTLDLLRRCVAQSDDQGIAGCVQALREFILLFGRATTPLLIDVLKNMDEDPRFRRHVAELLQAIKDPDAAQALELVAADPEEDEELRASSVLALARTGTPSAFEALVRTAESTDGRVQAVSLGSLSRFPSPRAVRALKDALLRTGTSHRSRHVALVSLGDLADKRAATSAEADEWTDDTTTDTDSGTVQGEATEALILVATKVMEELADDESTAIPASTSETEDAEDTDVDVSSLTSAAIHALGRTGSDEAAALLAKIYETTEVVRLRKEAVSALASFPNSDDARATVSAAILDEAPRVRMLAARSLLLMTQGEACSFVEAAMASETNANVSGDMRRALRSTPGAD